MKRRDLIRHLEKHGCELMREGGNHTVYVNRARRKTTQFRDTAKSTSFWREKSVKIWKLLNPKTRPTIRMDVRVKYRLCYLACLLNSEVHGGGFAPRHLNRSA